MFKQSQFQLGPNPVESHEKHWLILMYSLSCLVVITAFVGPLLAFLLALFLRNTLTTEYALSHVRRQVRIFVIAAIAMAASVIFMLLFVAFQIWVDSRSDVLFILTFVPAFLVMLWYFYKSIAGFVQISNGQPVI